MGGGVCGDDPAYEDGQACEGGLVCEGDLVCGDDRACEDGRVCEDGRAREDGRAPEDDLACGDDQGGGEARVYWGDGTCDGGEGVPPCKGVQFPLAQTNQHVCRIPISRRNQNQPKVPVSLLGLLGRKGRHTHRKSSGIVLGTASRSVKSENSMSCSLWST